MTRPCPGCGEEIDVDETRDRGECPECGRGFEALLALAAGCTPRSERDSGIRRSALRPSGVDEQRGGRS